MEIWEIVHYDRYVDDILIIFDNENLVKIRFAHI